MGEGERDWIVVEITCPVCRGIGCFPDPIVPEDSPRCWLCKGKKNVSRTRAKAVLGWMHFITPEWVENALSGSDFDPSDN